MNNKNNCNYEDLAYIFSRMLYFVISHQVSCDIFDVNFRYKADVYTAKEIMKMMKSELTKIGYTESIKPEYNETGESFFKYMMWVGYGMLKKAYDTNTGREIGNHAYGWEYQYHRNSEHVSEDSDYVRLLLRSGDSFF